MGLQQFLEDLYNKRRQGIEGRHQYERNFLDAFQQGHKMSPEAIEEFMQPMAMAPMGLMIKSFQGPQGMMRVLSGKDYQRPKQFAANWDQIFTTRPTGITNQIFKEFQSLPVEKITTLNKNLSRYNMRVLPATNVETPMARMQRRLGLTPEKSALKIVAESKGGEKIVGFIEKTPSGRYIVNPGGFGKESDKLMRHFLGEATSHKKSLSELIDSINQSIK